MTFLKPGSLFFQLKLLRMTKPKTFTALCRRQYQQRPIVRLISISIIISVSLSVLVLKWRNTSIVTELRRSRVSDVVLEPQFQHFLSACVIVREASDLMGEFLVRNHAAGVDHFFVYGDDDDPEEVARLRSIFKALEGLVTYIPNGRSAPTDEEDPDNYVQMRMYRHCLQQFGTSSKWVTLIDTDEFFETLSFSFSKEFEKTTSHRAFLHDVLTTHSMVPILCVRWRTALTNGRILAPKLGETLTDLFPRTCKVQVNNKEKLALRKMILQPRFIDMQGSPKLDVAIHKGFSFKGQMKRLHCKWGLVHDLEPPIYLIHYWSRDLSSYLRKIHRGRPRKSIPSRNLGDLFLRESMCTLEETSGSFWSGAMSLQSVIRKLPYFPPLQGRLANAELAMGAVGDSSNSTFTICKEHLSRLIEQMSAGRDFSDEGYCENRESDACVRLKHREDMSWPFPWVEYVTNCNPMPNENRFFV